MTYGSFLSFWRHWQPNKTSSLGQSAWNCFNFDIINFALKKLDQYHHGGWGFAHHLHRLILFLHLCPFHEQLSISYHLWVCFIILIIIVWIDSCIYMCVLDMIFSLCLCFVCLCLPHPHHLNWLLQLDVSFTWFCLCFVFIYIFVLVFVFLILIIWIDPCIQMCPLHEVPKSGVSLSAPLGLMHPNDPNGNTQSALD